MGGIGPVPKRSDEIMGHRTKAERAQRETHPGVGKPVPIPDPQPDWHPLAIAWYQSLAESGQHQYYEASDWAVAGIVAETMSRTLKRSYATANHYSVILSGCSDLLSTEGARRRLRLELQRHQTVPDTAEGVTAINEYKKRVSG